MRDTVLTPLQRKAEASVGMPLAKYLQEAHTRHTINHCAVSLGVDPKTVRRWARAVGVRFSGDSSWRDYSG